MLKKWRTRNSKLPALVTVTEQDNKNKYLFTFHSFYQRVPSSFTKQSKKKLFIHVMNTFTPILWSNERKTEPFSPFSFRFGGGEMTSGHLWPFTWHSTAELRGQRAKTKENLENTCIDGNFLWFLLRKNPIIAVYIFKRPLIRCAS